MKDIFNYLAKILNVNPVILENLDCSMTEKTGKEGVLEKVYKENEKNINHVLGTLNSLRKSTYHVLSVLRRTILNHEEQLLDFLKIVEGETEFEKAVKLAKQISKIKKGLFLKREHIQKILTKNKPQNLLKYLKVSSVEDALKEYDAVEIFASLRFIESNEWMHKTFEGAYSNFTINDFEEREIEIKVLSPIWREIAKKFVNKKHHNVSHLKEFGVIFINPIKENIPGKFLRDFTLIFHYLYEISFYSKLFRKYLMTPDFSNNFKMLLRGDVQEINKLKNGEWLIVQRYLAKENPNDPRLFLPRVNSESFHWMRGERDLTLFSAQDSGLNLRLWYDLDWVGGIFEDGSEKVISFDLEDNAMSLVSFSEGRNEIFNYHQREAMWTKIFSEYVNGEEEMEKLLIDNFDKGIIKF